MCIVACVCVTMTNARTRLQCIGHRTHGHRHVQSWKMLAALHIRHWIRQQQSQLGLPLNLAGGRATHAHQEAVTAGRWDPALQLLKWLLGQNRKTTTQQAALSSCWRHLFLRPPGALLPRGALPRPHAPPWTQAALSTKRGGCVDSLLGHAEPARARTHPPLLCSCEYIVLENRM
jgi:hypothetical protein